VAGKRSFGQITKLPSGRYRARYTGPDARLHNAPSTFGAKIDAEAWLAAERKLTEDPLTWRSPKDRIATARSKQLLFGDYAEAWLANRKVKGRALADRTRDHYRDLLDRYILPTFHDVALKTITSEDVDRWYDLTAVGKPTTQAHAYSLLRTILGTAVDRGHLPYNPAKIRGGGTTKRASKTKIATLEELALITAAMPERRRLMILLAAWCSLRFGELAELRRGDVDTKKGIIHIRRGVVRVRQTAEDGTVTHVRKVKTPKSDAGVRDVPIPPHLLDDVRGHLLAHTAPGKDGLLFPGRDGAHLSSSAFYGHIAKLNKDGSIRRKGDGYFEARRQAGRPDLRFHDLRHTGLTNAAIAGATLAELMQLAGHSTAGAAMRYQNVAKDRMQDLAKKLSKIAEGDL
jgi:integrase